MLETHGDIEKNANSIKERLNKLSNWQRGKQNLLFERQNKERQILGEMRQGSNRYMHDPPKSHNEQTSTKNPQEAQKKIVRRPFLKRGEGIKQRFKIDPEALRLDNLPKYKYAPKKRAEINNENSSIRNSQSMSSITTDVHEQCFQKPHIESLNAFSSTPESRHFTASSYLKSSLNEDCSSHNSETAKANVLSMAWFKVLDSQQIKAIPIQQIRGRSNEKFNVEDENLSIFEMLELKANDGTIDMNCSTVQRLLKNREDDDDDTNSDILCVDENLRELGLSPMAPDIEDDDDSDSSEDSAPRELNETNDYEDSEQNFQSNPVAKTKARVHWAEENNTHEYEESTMVCSETEEVSNFEDIGLFEQFKEVLFAALQNQAMPKSDHQNPTDANESSIESKESTELDHSPVRLPFTEDLQEKTNLLKARLAELEKEIKLFKENNLDLMKQKQQFELEKEQLRQEHLEAMEKVNDEKIRIEIELHDERMKLEQDKQKFEQHMRVQKSTLSTKKQQEITDLKKELEDVRSQLKNKEQAHIAAQARLRAQIRNLEKDQKCLLDDIEKLKLENKKLENENLKIARDNKNKMLQEINKNIAKLAPKCSITNNDQLPTNKSTSKAQAAKTVSFSKSLSQKSLKNQQRKESGHQDCRSTAGASTSRSNSKSKLSQASLYLSLSESEHSDICDFDSNNNNNSNNESMEPENEEHKQCKANLQREENKTSSNGNPTAPQTAKENMENSNELNEFKREIVNSDGSKDILYQNGSIKKMSADGMLIRMLYFNKDIKETNIKEGTIKYYYAESNTWHTTYLDGLEIFEFPNGQTEHRHKNGKIEVHYPNNSIKVIDPKDELKSEEWRFVDGTTLVHLRSGDKILSLPNGQKEIHTNLHKRREYPDGTVKFVYPDGSQETRYSNGRVRLKDKDGNLVLDTESRGH